MEQVLGRRLVRRIAPEFGNIFSIQVTSVFDLKYTLHAYRNESGAAIPRSGE